MTQDQMISLAKQAAIAHGLEPSLVCAVCEQESGWDPWAIRFEPLFDERYEKGKVRNVTEEIGRSMSWGLMQTMGETARDVGWTDHLGALLLPENSLEIGCRKLKQLVDAAPGNSPAIALQRWNGGGNPDYARQVLARVARYQDTAA